MRTVAEVMAAETGHMIAAEFKLYVHLAACALSPSLLLGQCNELRVTNCQFVLFAGFARVCDRLTPATEALSAGRALELHVGSRISREFCVCHCGLQSLA